MSAENVELVRSLLPPPDVDVKALVNDDAAALRQREAVEHLYDRGVQCTMRFPGMAPVTYPGGIDGLREAWRDWLNHGSSYRVEIDDVLDGGERVLVVHRGTGRHNAEGRAGHPQESDDLDDPQGARRAGGLQRPLRRSAGGDRHQRVARPRLRRAGALPSHASSRSCGSSRGRLPRAVDADHPRRG